MVFSTKKTSPNKESTKNPLILDRKLLSKSENVSACQPRWDPLFSVWIWTGSPTKASVFVERPANCGGEPPLRISVQNGRCEPPNFLDHDSSHKKNTPKVFIKWCCVAVTKTCDFAGLGVLWPVWFKNFTHQLLFENSDICLVFYVFFRPNEDKINGWQMT